MVWSGGYVLTLREPPATDIFCHDITVSQCSETQGSKILSVFNFTGFLECYTIRIT